MTRCIFDHWSKQWAVCDNKIGFICAFIHICVSFLRYFNDVMMSTVASQITSLTIVYSSVYSGAGQRKHQNSAPMAFVRRIHRWPVNSPHKWPVTRKIFPFDDVIIHYAKHYGWEPNSMPRYCMVGFHSNSYEARELCDFSCRWNFQFWVTCNTSTCGDGPCNSKIR